MLRIKKLADMLDKQVYTDNGEFFGKVEEINVVSNKIDGWRIVAKDVSMLNLLGGARGIIVPHQFIKAIGDIVIVSKNAVPIQRQEENMSIDGNEEEVL
jgi:sporulation protein YlmC with PRC-barrel domain